MLGASFAENSFENLLYYASFDTECLVNTVVPLVGNPSILVYCFRIVVFFTFSLEFDYLSIHAYLVPVVVFS